MPVFAGISCRKSVCSDKKIASGTGRDYACFAGYGYMPLWDPPEMMAVFTKTARVSIGLHSIVKGS